MYFIHSQLIESNRCQCPPIDDQHPSRKTLNFSDTSISTAAMQCWQWVKSWSDTWKTTWLIQSCRSIMYTFILYIYVECKGGGHTHNMRREKEREGEGKGRRGISRKETIHAWYTHVGTGSLRLRSFIKISTFAEADLSRVNYEICDS